MVLATIATAMGLVATPRRRRPGDPGPLTAVDFVGAWTNDDGGVDGGDVGDTGGTLRGYDAWRRQQRRPRADPGPGCRPRARGKDVAICTAGVEPGDPDSVDVTVQTAYPGYVCTFTARVANATSLPVRVAPAVVTPDPVPPGGPGP